MSIIGSIKNIFARPVQVWAEYTASPPTLADGDTAPLQIDANGQLKIAGGGGGSGNQGTPNTAANAWPVKITDGTQIAAVKAASTPPVAGDTAQSVDVRPGGVLPASAAPADGTTNATSLSAIRAWVMSYNGTAWDRIRSGLGGVQTTFAGVLNAIPMGQFVSAPPSLANGNVAPLQLDTSGNLKTIENGGGAYPTAAAAADTVTNPTITKVGAYNVAFNGTTWDRVRAGLNGVLTVVTGVLNSVPLGQFNLTKPTLADTNWVQPQVDANGNLRTAEQFAGGYENNAVGVAYTLSKAVPTNDGAWSFTSSAGTAIGTAGVSIKAAPGRVRRITVTNKNATTGFYFMLHNKASAPVASDAPVERYWVPERDATVKETINTIIVDFGPDGLYLGTGIGIAASSAVDSVTLLAGLDCHYNIVWI